MDEYLIFMTIFLSFFYYNPNYKLNKNNYIILVPLANFAWENFST